MDVEKLIMLVKHRSEIYDIKHPNHRNKDVICNNWKEIAQILDTTDLKAKSKWQNLRSNYMREKRKIASIESGLESERVIWPFYSKLSFIDDNVHFRKKVKKCPENYSEETNNDSQQVGNEINDFKNIWINEEKVIYSNNSNENLHASFDDASGSNSVSDNIVGGYSPALKKQKLNSYKEDDMHRLHLKELETMSIVSQEANDSDLMFLKSLLPSIKKLGPIENLEFKGEVIQLLQCKLKPIVSNSKHSK